tara:strand:- start:1584 stop:1832 length:249 start_codon:yes stop_codon:yes gene_type:complete
VISESSNSSEKLLLKLITKLIKKANCTDACGATLQASLERFEKAVYDSITNPEWSEDKKQAHVAQTLQYEKKSLMNVEQAAA